jgi:hypothetical protein
MVMKLMARPKIMPGITAAPRFTPAALMARISLSAARRPYTTQAANSVVAGSV